MNRVIVPVRQATQAGGIHSLESIPGLHKRLKIRAGGPVRQPYSYSVPSPQRLLKNYSTVSQNNTQQQPSSRPPLFLIED
jgi:hypothetical protein